MLHTPSLQRCRPLPAAASAGAASAGAASAGAAAAAGTGCCLTQGSSTCTLQLDRPKPRVLLGTRGCGTVRGTVNTLVPRAIPLCGVCETFPARVALRSPRPSITTSNLSEKVYKSQATAQWAYALDQQCGPTCPHPTPIRCCCLSQRGAQQRTRPGEAPPMPAPAVGAMGASQSLPPEPPAAQCPCPSSAAASLAAFYPVVFDQMIGLVGPAGSV